ncbi:TetR/AcrR family transcriptional regulator [Rhodococcus sp. NPDC056960]|uniref:TetR/AcrR family transcriptional regulator n=1 Tax=Rhodococcus sp. NPDC056960 TaxID=3345982 RepID=UPI00362E9AC0
MRVPADERRRALIQAAIEVVAEHGIEGATTRRIAERAGSPLARLHYCFSSKEELIVAIFESLANDQFEAAVHIRPGVGLGRAAASMLRQLAAWIDREPTFARAQVELVFWIARQKDSMASKVYQMAVDVFAERLREGMRDDDDPNLVELFAKMIAAYGDGMVVQGVAFGHKGIREDLLDTTAESFERLAEAHRLVH